MDVGRSVSRVGGKAQAAAIKPLAESLRLGLAAQEPQTLELDDRSPALSEGACSMRFRSSASGRSASGCARSRAANRPPGDRALRQRARFVGGFNQRLIESLESDLRRTDALMIVGSRGAAFACERGHVAAWSHLLAIRLAGIQETVRLLVEELLPRISRDEIVRAEVIFGRYRRSGELAFERRRLFPLQLVAAGGTRRGLPPLHDLSAAELLERLTAQYISAQLTEAATEALAAENAARFTAMESARDNVARKLQTLRLEASRARQEEVTTELLDLITGERTVTGQG